MCLYRFDPEFQTLSVKVQNKFVRESAKTDMFVRLPNTRIWKERELSSWNSHRNFGIQSSVSEFKWEMEMRSLDSSGNLTGFLPILLSMYVCKDSYKYLFQSWLDITSVIVYKNWIDKIANTSKGLSLQYIKMLTNFFS